MWSSGCSAEGRGTQVVKQRGSPVCAVISQGPLQPGRLWCRRRRAARGREEEGEQGHSEESRSGQHGAETGTFVSA